MDRTKNNSMTVIDNTDKSKCHLKTKQQRKNNLKYLHSLANDTSKL